MLPLFLPLRPSLRRLKYPLNSYIHTRFVAVAQQDPQINRPEIKEPSPKIQKLDQIPPFLRVKKLSEKAILPSRGSLLSAGYHLSSAMETKVPARGKALIPTDLSIAVPEGTYARIGVIDADSRGPVGVILFNYSDVDFEVKEGEKIAQLIIEKIVTPEVTEVDDLDSTARGSGGCGSNGGAAGFEG
ncbi:hypothetical protein LguiA_012865 [Lonicera macranthoides]